MISLMKKTIVTAVFLTAAVFANTVFAMTEPDVVVKQTVDKVIENIQANRQEYKADSQKLYTMVEEVLIPTIHTQRMGQLIMGKNWRAATPEQQKQFIEEFKAFLLHSYASALLEYSGDEKVVYKPLERKPDVDKVVVKAELINAAGEAFPINLYMSNRRDTSWRAYNIEVAGINFVSTYRTTFNDIVSNKGIDGLLADLKKKNANLKK